MKKKQPKRRPLRPQKQPQDATLRNARASKKRDVEIEARLSERITALEARVETLENPAPIPPPPPDPAS
jgi:hypothetical protein